MSVSDRKTLRYDESTDTTETGAPRWQYTRVEEWWETLGADGKPYVRCATRADAIDRHLRSNAGLSDHRQWMTEHGKQPGTIIGEPLTAIRHVTRHETHTSWEVVDEAESLDELTEITNTQPCAHPQEWIYESTGRHYCGRCGEKVQP